MQGNLTRDEARARAALLANVRYSVALDLADQETDRFGSTTVVEFDAAPEGATFVDLQGADVTRASLNDRDLPVDAYDGARLRLEGLADHNRLEVHARGRYSNAGVGLHRFVDPVDGEIFLYTQFEPFDAHRVFACFDQPDLKAPLTLTVRAPAAWEVVANGAVASHSVDGATATWQFRETPRIPTYVAAVVAGPYAKETTHHGDIPLGLYIRRSLAEHLDTDELFELTAAGLDWFERAFGHPYPFGKYDQLFVPEFNFGAMENPACVTFSERYVYRSRVTSAARLDRAVTVLHEMAHMWFGDLVTMRWWDDLWLNESFATYISHLAVAEATAYGRRSWSDFAQSLKAWAYHQDQLPTTHPIVADVLDTDTALSNFDGITYAKGASVLRQLAAFVGRDSFLEGLQGYFRRHQWGNAELADFLGALEGRSDRDLKRWSRTWLETSGVSTLRTNLRVAGGRIAALAIDQEPPEPPAGADAPPADEDGTSLGLRSHRIALGLYDEQDGALIHRTRLEFDVDGERTDVPQAEGLAAPALLLINEDDLTYAKIRLDPGSVAALERGLSTIADPVTRAVAWTSLWDATRDVELRARRYLELVAEHAGAEPDVGLLQRLLVEAHSVITTYGDPANRPAARNRLAGVARAQLDSAEPSSDEQLVWVRTLVATRTDEGFGRGLLDGTVEVDGLAVDADLRWQILGHLAAMGAADADAIAAEEERDPTDIGKRGAAGCRAARPLAEGKAEAWERALADRDPLHMRRALLNGFWQPDQDELLTDYATSHWVDALPMLWQNRPVEEALSLTHVLYPKTVVSEAVVAASDRALSTLDLPRPARRAVLEEQDATRRALRARRRDAQEDGDHRG